MDEETLLCNFCLGADPVPVPFTCSFESSDICDMVQSKEDDFDWDRRRGSTTTGDTGPDEARDDQYYMYTEATNTKDGEQAE